MITASELHSLINFHYSEPKLSTWKPSEYDMEHNYNTSRKLKKLEGDREKHNAKLKADYDLEMMKWNAVHKVIDDLNTWPEEVADLFLDAIHQVITTLDLRHKKFIEAKNAIDEKYGMSLILNAKWHLNKLLDHAPGHRGVASDAMEKWDAIASSYRGEFKKQPDGKFGYDLPLKSIKDPKDLLSMFAAYRRAEDFDDVALHGEHVAYMKAIQGITSKIADIMNDIMKIFDRKVPEKCERGGDWGVDGHFNGVLSCGSKRISFCSFIAGGWNIQRLHCRFKITELKSTEA